jgi:hypothetical protein
MNNKYGVIIIICRTNEKAIVIVIMIIENDNINDESQ